MVITMSEIKYETVNNEITTRESAIALADYCLKNSIYRKARKRHFYYGLIYFDKFDIALVNYKGFLAWHIKVIEGEWGATEYKFFHRIYWDGDFDESSNISCLITLDNDFIEDFDINEIAPVSSDKYKDYK